MPTRTLAAGGGNWNVTGTWAEGAVPTAADDVVLGASSGNLTINAAAACRSFDCTGYTGTVTHNASVTLSIGTSTAGPGNLALKFVAGMTYSKLNATSSAVTFVSTNATQQTIDTAGKSMGGFTINGAGSSYILASSLTSTGALTISNGSFDTANYAMTLVSISTTTSNTRNIQLGSSAINLSSSMTVSGLTNLTFNAGTSTITGTGNSFTISVSAGGLTLYDVIHNGSSTFTLSGGPLTCHNFSRTGTAVKTCDAELGGNLTCSGTLTLQGNSAINRMLLWSSVIGTARTVSAATVSFANIDFEDITAAGASAPWDTTAITGLAGDVGGNTNITFPASISQTMTYSGTTNQLVSTYAWATRVPLAHDDVVLAVTYTTASRSTTFDMPRCGRNISGTQTGTTSNVSFSTGVITGSITLPTGLNGVTGTFDLRGRGTHTVAFSSPSGTNSVQLIVNAVTGTYTMQDSYVSTSTFSLTSGTFDTNNQTMQCLTITATGTVTRSLVLGTTTWTLTDTSGTGVSIAATGMTLSAASSTIRISTTSASVRTWALGGLTYGTLDYTVAGSTGGWTLSGNNTIGTINFSDANNGRTLTLPNSGTTTIGTFNVNGSASGNMSVTSSSTGSTTLVKTGGGQTSIDRVTLTRVIGSTTGGATWYAGANSTDGGGNTNWVFTAPPTVPPAPTLNSATRTASGEVTVNYSSNGNGGSVNLDYPITASPVGGGTDVTATGDGSGTWAVTGLTNGVEYSFTVQARNAIGTGAASNAITATPYTVPNAPTNAVATAGHLSASVAFDAPADNGGNTITGYTVTSSPGGLTGTGASSPIVVSSLTAWTDYTFTVRATNAAGDSAESAASNAVTVYNQNQLAGSLTLTGSG